MFDGTDIDRTGWTASELQGDLMQLQAERALASLEDVFDEAYAEELDE